MARRSLANHKAGNSFGQYLPNEEAQYVVDVQGVKIVTNHKKKDFFVVEFDIVETDTTSVRLGSRFSWTKPFEDEWGYGPADIKGWICTAIEQMRPGSDPVNNWEDDFVDEVAAEGDNDTKHEQPCRGMRFGISTRLKPKVNSSGYVTLVDWEALDPGTVLGLTSQPTHRSAANSGPAPAPAPAPPAPQAPPEAPAARLPADPPKGWPPGMPWPPKTAA